MNTPSKNTTKPMNVGFMALAIVIPGFSVLLLCSLVANRVEAKYLRAFEMRNVSQEGRIYELEKLLKDKEIELALCR